MNNFQRKDTPKIKVKYIGLPESFLFSRCRLKKKNPPINVMFKIHTKIRSTVSINHNSE